MKEINEVLKITALEMAQETAFSLDWVAGVNGGFHIPFKKLERVILEAMKDGARLQRIALGCEPDDDDEDEEHH
jgi:hypothetical protein